MSPKTQSFVLLLIEVMCIVFILLTGPFLVQNLLFFLLQLFGALLILWSFLAIKVNHVKKVPGGVNFWVDKGPYEIVRHPIYTGLLLVMSGFIQWFFTLPRFLVFVLLIIVILIKIQAYEKLLEEVFKDDYRKYKDRTHKIIPYFY